MKKIIGTLAAICFFTVNVAIAQTPAPSAKAEPAKVEKKDACCKKGAETKACCKKGGEASTKSCSSEQAKSCTPAQKASCSHGDKAKAEATVAPASEKKVEAQPQH